MEAVLGIILGLLGAVGLSYLRSSGFKGKVGEARVRSALSKLDSDAYKTFDDLILPSGEGTTQIDHVIVSEFGVFVVETKNMQGWIFGDARQAKWTQIIYGHKSRFQNPIRQNFKHLKAIQVLLGIPIDHIHNVVVFTGSAKPKTPMPDQVVWGASSLPGYVRSKQTVVLDETDVLQLVDRLSNNGLRSTIETNRAHVKHLKAKVADRNGLGNSCPKCSSRMVKRTNRKTGESFLGCSQFPRCKGTRKRA